MYFNRKNAEQKNWRMIKKGKHFLFGCSLVFAVGAALVAPSVKADTVETKPEAGSTTEEIKPVAAGENVTYAAPAVEVAPSTPVAPAPVVAEEKAEKPATTTENSKEEAVATTEKVEKAKEADSIQAPELTVVYDPSALTDEEKAKVVAAVKAANPTATDVQVQADGSVVVTFADGSSANLTAAQTIKDGSQVARVRRTRAQETTAARATEGAENLDYTNKPDPEGIIKMNYEVDNAKNTIHWTVVVNGGRVGNQASGYSYFTVPKDSVGTPTNWRVLQTDKNGNTMSDRRYWKDNDGIYPMGGAGKMNIYTGSEMTKELTKLYKEIGNPAIKGNEAAAAQQASERSQALYMLTADVAGGIFKNPSWTITFDTPIIDKSKPLDYTAGLQGTAGIGGKTNIMAGYADNFIDNASSKFQAVAVKEKYTAKVGGSFAADPAIYVTNKAGTPEFPNNYRGATTFAWKDGQAPTATEAGTYTKTVVVTYPAHYNQAPQEVTITFEVEGQTPKPVAPAGQAPEITSNLSGKASTPADVTVKAPAGSTVKLYNKDGVVIGEAVANDQGVATITPTNSLPEGEITATSTPAGGNESPKSTPITATRAEKPELDGGVSRGNDNTQLLVTRSHITVYPGESVNIGVVAASNAIANFWANNPYGVSGLAPTGNYITTAGTDTIRQRPAGYGGTVAWTQPAGDTVVTFAVRSKKNAVVTRDLKVTVLELTKKLDAVPGEKVEVADLNNVSENEKNKIIAATEKANSNFPPGTLYNVDQRGNLVITYPDKSTDKIAAVYLVNPIKDTTAPDKPVLNTDLTGKAGTKTPVEVTAEKGSTVALYDKDNNKIGEATAGENGKATITPTVDIPAGNVTAKATDAAGNTSDASNPKVATDTTAPAKPVVNTDLTGKAGTKPSVEVSAEPGSTVALYDKAGNKIGEGTAGSNGKVTITPTVDIPAGNVTAKATDAAGNTSDASNPKVATDTTAPAKPVVNTDLTGKAGTKPSIEVSAEPGSTVALYDKAGNKIGEGTAGSNGKVTITPTVDIPAGNVTAKATDAAGNTSVASDPKVATDTTAPAKPVVNTDLTGKAGTKTPVEVTAEKGSTVALYDKVGNKIGEATAGANGKATITPTVNIPAGNVTAKATDAAGNTSVASDPATATATATVVAPTVEIPYSNKNTKEVYVYAGEENSFDIKFKDDSGKIASATVKQGGNRAFADVAGEANTINTQYGFKANVITTETLATADAPAVITYRGTPAATDGLSQDRLTAATKGENPAGLPLGWRYATATDTDGAFIENRAVGSSNATDPGSFRVVVKAQNQKYDIATPTEKVTVANPSNVTEDELNKVKEKLQLEYSQTNDDANLAGKKGTTADKTNKIQSVTKDADGNLVVTYTDGSVDKKPLSEFVTKDTEAPAKPVVNTDLTGKAGTKTPVEVTAEPGSTVALYDKDNNKIGEGTADNNGKVTITPTVDIPAGNVTAKATKDGQTSDASAPKEATAATPAKPSKPVVDTDLTGKAGTKTPVEVTAEPGTKVELFDKDGNKIGEATADNNGKVTITPTVEIPAGPVTAKASKDGKTSDESTPKVATKDPAITPVVNPSALTDAEKAKVADEVKKANPTASKVEVGNDGTATVTFPDGSVAVLTPEKTVKEADSNGVKTPAITPVVNPSALTDVEKAKVADEVKKANPTATDIKVNNDGSVVVTFADGSVAVLASENVVKEATKESPAQEPAKKAGAKELPNTGTKQSSASLALALLAAATGGLLIAKKREEEE